MTEKSHTKIEQASDQKIAGRLDLVFENEEIDEDEGINFPIIATFAHTTFSNNFDPDFSFRQKGRELPISRTLPSNRSFTCIYLI